VCLSPWESPPPAAGQSPATRKPVAQSRLVLPVLPAAKASDRPGFRRRPPVPPSSARARNTLIICSSRAVVATPCSGHPLLGAGPAPPAHRRTRPSAALRHPQPAEPRCLQLGGQAQVQL
jgi:hypothetical protein